MKILIKIINLLFFIFFFSQQTLLAQEKIKVGLLVPLTGEQSEIGRSILKSVRMAINKIDNANFEIIPKDTKNDPNITLRSAKELQEDGIKIIIGPIFNKNLIYLNEINEVTFLSLTNKNTNKYKNVISAGINASSQLKAIKKFIKKNNLKKTIFLIPDSDFKNEIDNSIKEVQIKYHKKYYYNTDPTILTKQIEKITKYKERKLDLSREIKKLENSEISNKETKIAKLKKKDTLGKVNFDSVIISDFDESLKSITTSLLYTDVPPKDVSYILFNQWFDTSLLKETSSHPMFFPSINKKNYEIFIKEYESSFGEAPSQLSIISFDLVGLVYYLALQNNFKVDEKLFYKKTKFKGKIGVFEIDKNKITHVLNFYQVNEKGFKRIF
tara:strand:+ start:3721 stop:4872 length:1152 start_codon:yes stop_codon:yes gene_type:complete